MRIIKNMQFFLTYPLEQLLQLQLKAWERVDNNDGDDEVVLLLMGFL
jgi:hypothetical protein